jgi:integrase
VFKAREELVTSIRGEWIPVQRRTLYAFLGLTGARYGEAAGLRWRHLDLDARPLGRVLIATSYDRGQTKTGAERRVPIHSTLGTVLAEWRLSH